MRDPWITARRFHCGYRFTIEDTDAERRCEGKCGEPVEGGLQQELVGTVSEAFVDRAEDRERADAEDQGADDEALDEPLLALGGVAAGQLRLQSATEVLESVLES